jgi:hypothetical protein
MDIEVMGRAQMCPLYRKVARTAANPSYGKEREGQTLVPRNEANSLKRAVCLISSSHSEYLNGDNGCWAAVIADTAHKLNEEPICTQHNNLKTSYHIPTVR